VLKAGTDIVHFDVMDNHYVPNLDHRPPGLRGPAQARRPPPDRRAPHGEAGRPDRPRLRQGRRDLHHLPPEASEHVDRTLQLIRDCGCKSGLVFNPATPLSYLEYVMDKSTWCC